MQACRVLTMALASLCVASAFAQASPADPTQEAPYQLDDVQTTATRERELVVRTVLAGLKRNKSDRPEDSELIVCEKGKRTGTNITTIRCGKNRAWLALGAESARANADFFGTTPAGLAPNETPANRLLPILVKASTGTPYNARLDTELLEFELSLLLNQDDYPGDLAEHEARIYQLLEKERLAAEAEQEAFIRFVLAWNAVRRADAAVSPGCATDATCSAAHAAALERAIVDTGLTVKQYNAAVTRLEIDPKFRSRVVAALQKSQ